MHRTQEYFDFIDEEFINSHVGYHAFNEAITVSPLSISSEEQKSLEERHDVIEVFFQTILDLFYASLEGEIDPEFSKFLLNDSKSWIPGTQYLKNLGLAKSTPKFYRTDESLNGKILEIQPPGSGWGDLELLKRLYTQFGCSESLRTFEPSTIIANSIKQLTGSDSPSVFHMMDNSSNPASIKYFISTLHDVRHWGYDKDVRYGECDLIRSHSVRGILAENLFETRLNQCNLNQTIFDLPPIPIFDQKLILAVPFMDEFRKHFTDKIRDSIAYTAVLEPSGFIDINGEKLSLDDFLKKSPKKRRYFLKYGGCDTNLNWGSRGVFRLDGGDAKKRLELAASDYQKGRYWIIQPEEASKETISFVNRTSPEVMKSKMTSKYSCFYTPLGLVGIRSMHRSHFKVHGQYDTALGLRLPKTIKISE